MRAYYGQEIIARDHALSRTKAIEALVPSGAPIEVTFIYGPEVMQKLLTISMFIVVGIYFCDSAKSAPGNFLSLDEPCVIQEGEVLPGGFKGHSTFELATKFATLRPKDQYESDGEYDARQSAELATWPKAVREGVLCVVADIRRVEDRFDADSGILYVSTASTYRGSVFANGKIHEIGRVLGDSRGVKRSSHEASNAFGASTTVYRHEGTKYYVGFRKSQLDDLSRQPGFGYDLMTLKVELPMGGAEAREINKRLKVAYLYEPSPPFFIDAHDIELPTIDMSFETQEQQKVVLATLKAIAIFDGVTGRVIKIVSTTGI